MIKDGRALLEDAFEVEQHRIEDAVIGGLLQVPEVAGHLTRILKPSDFTQVLNRNAFIALCELVRSEKLSVSIADVERALIAKGVNPDDGWLSRLWLDVNASNLTDYVDRLRDSSKRRSLQIAMRQAFSDCMDPTVQPAEIIRSVVDRLGEIQKAEGGKYSPQDYTAMMQEHPNLNEPVIDGLLRTGETCNLIAASKIGKSFMSVNLAWSVSQGMDWLGFKIPQPGRVLIIDNELHRATLTHRIDRVADSLMIPFESRADKIDVISLRGELCDINQLERRLFSIPPGFYRLVILDALYRALPDGTSENDNAGMMHIYNRLDKYAANLGSAIVVVHHASKGGQGEKGVTDVGSGAGSISRAPDSHLIIRPHTKEGLSVLEAATRSWPSPQPISICYEYPVWNSVAETPEVKTRVKSSDQQKSDQRDVSELVAAIPKSGQILQADLFEAAAVGAFGKSKRIADLMVKQGLAERRKDSSKPGKPAVFYSLPGGNSES